MAIDAPPIKLRLTQARCRVPARRLDRIANGTAVVVGVFSVVLDGSGGDYRAAMSDTLLCASGVMALGFVVAVVELVRRRSRGDLPPPTPRPEHHIHHL